MSNSLNCYSNQQIPVCNFLYMTVAQAVMGSIALPAIDVITLLLITVMYLQLI